jgi:hypothetical protein
MMVGCIIQEVAMSSPFRAASRRPSLRTLPLLLAALAVLLPGAARPLAAQRGAVRLLVVDDETGDPITHALVKLKNRPELFTDNHGRLTLDSLPHGKLEIEVIAMGYDARKEPLFIQADQTPDRRIGLSFTGDKLPDLVVEARQEKLYPRYQDFHRRRQTGSGFYITWKEIKSKGYNRLGDVMRNVRGVQVKCVINDCEYIMSRSSFCHTAIWVDGRPSDFYGGNLPINDVYGLEVYRGSSELPAEFVGTGGCGAVVIWTKNRTYR